MAESAQDLLKKGIAAAQAGQKDQARTLLQQAVRLDPQNELIWLWLSSVAKNNQERIFCLRQLLQINPQNEMALKGLRALGVAAAPSQTAAGGTDSPAAPGTPIPSEQSLKAIQSQLDELLAEYTAHTEPDLGFEWAHKTRGRAGEQSATRLRVGLVAGVAIVAIAMIGIIVVVGGSVISSALAPTVTPTPPPYTATPTVTPGPTNTPSPVPRVPPTLTATYEPTLEALNGAYQFLELGRTLTPTPVYKEREYASEADLKNLQEAYINGEYDESIRLAKRAREGSAEKEFDTYFYEAMAYAMQGDYDEAEDVLTTGDIVADGLRIEDFQNEDGLLSGYGESTVALLNAAAGYVYYKLNRLEESISYNEYAMQSDPTFALPILTQAEVYMAQGRTNEAYDLILRATTNQARLRYNVLLLIKLGEIELLRDNPDAALTLARQALYIDPLAEDAYLLAANADIAFGQRASNRAEATGWYGRAVLDMQAYLLYYPDNIRGWATLGKARYFEGNMGQALAAFNHALETNIPEDTMTLELREALQDAYLTRAAMFAGRQLYLQAIDDYTNALQLGESPAALEGRASAYFTIADYRRAQLDLESLLEVDPNNIEYQMMLAQALVELQEYEDAEPVLQALENNGSLDNLQTGNVHEYLALIFYRRAEAQSEEGRDSDLVEQASIHIEQALAAGQSGTRHYYRGLIREMQGTPELAQNDYEWLLMWGEVYNYAFLPEVEARLEAVEEALEAES